MIAKVTPGSHSRKVVGARIGFQRRTLGMTQERLASLAGVSRETVCRIEQGSDLSVQTFARIVGALGVDAHRLLFGIVRGEEACE